MRPALRIATLAASLSLAVTAPGHGAGAQPVQKDGAARGAPPHVARFDWFEYAGHDAVYDTNRPRPGEYTNPILMGFHPDPSITRAGDDYYLVNSTFAYFPGIPVFHSRDLVSWTQIGSVIDRPSQLRLDSLGVSRGVFAPAIAFHAGTFYVVNTCVDCGGNFLVTATDPAGPWSDPIWLGFDGIDPSLFFDDDGKAYVVNNGAPVGPPLYSGHRAIWIQELDLATKQLVGERTLIVNGGVDIRTKPSWIEGPHLLKRDGRYYLIAAEGGTGDFHSEVVFGAPSVRGPYTPWSGNPILTQRNLDRNRPDPITSTGHADFVTLPDGDTWAVFLGTRPYADDTYNTGRETFLMRVSWRDGWPVLTSGQEGVPYVAPRPTLPAQPAPTIPTRGNFTVRDDFSGRALAPYWLMLRTPRETWWDLTSAPGSLSLAARPVPLSSRGQPSFLGRRQQHLTATVTTSMRWAPTQDGDRAGLVAFQSENAWYFLAVGRDGGKPVVQVVRRAGRGPSVADSVLASAPLPTGTTSPIELRITARRDRYDFAYATTPNRWTTLLANADATVLSTRSAGGFVGVLFALHAYAAP
ncbi:glycoside hydrolase family 43 [Gemmatirosa kalamazoonensis]|uniref:Glycoside hydrolase family 43 n=1 Tax=Gemmatirosa kalamazoonensis TaxID=861299 RepID=W0RNH7_9BACT|nr:glycoside hydrolase family 43 protein [Gemmatirosa kalamazoonensis]AHG92052.1 glycoside hydrolase family 43 [Gemmatirosa kalamazoonensis]